MNGNSRDRCPRPGTLTSPLPLFFLWTALEKLFSAEPVLHSQFTQNKRQSGCRGTAPPTLGYAPHIYNKCRRPATPRHLQKSSGGLWNRGTSRRRRRKQIQTPQSPRAGPAPSTARPPRPHKPPPEEDTIDGRHQPRPKPRLT